MMLLNAEMESLGLSTSTGSKHKAEQIALAASLLSRLEPVSANVFIPTVCADLLKSKEQRFEAVATLAMGSSETARHLEIFNPKKNLGTLLQNVRASQLSRKWDWVDAWDRQEHLFSANS